jgi:hypothetical protein
MVQARTSSDFSLDCDDATTAGGAEGASGRRTVSVSAESRPPKPAAFPDCPEDDWPAADWLDDDWSDDD